MAQSPVDTMSETEHCVLNRQLYPDKSVKPPGIVAKCGSTEKPRSR